MLTKLPLIRRCSVLSSGMAQQVGQSFPAFVLISLSFKVLISSVDDGYWSNS